MSSESSDSFNSPTVLSSALLGHGLVHHFRPGELVGFRWDVGEEQFVQMSTEEAEGLRSGLLEMDRYLGAYPDGQSETFTQLTYHVDETLLGSLVRGQLQVDSDREDFAFTRLPTRRELQPEDLLDSSRILGKVIDTTGSWERLLGELQLCFVLFWLGNNYEAFQQWKGLLGVICSASRYTQQYPEKVTELMIVLRRQMGEFPLEAFQGLPTEENILHKHIMGRLLDDFQRPGEEIPGGRETGGTPLGSALWRRLWEEADNLSRLLLERFGWLSAPSDAFGGGEDGPTIVNLQDDDRYVG